MSWIQLNLEVVTPIFVNGASEVDLRVPSIIGATRYWLRALTNGLTSSDKATLELESRVFGGVDGQTPTQSVLQLRMAQRPKVTSGGPIASLVESGPTSSLAYLCGLGLYSKGKLTRGFIPTHTPQHARNVAVLEIRLRSIGAEAAAELAMNALWLALTIGGIGARTRRGFGGLRIASCSTRTGTLPDWVKNSWVYQQPDLKLSQPGGPSYFTAPGPNKSIPNLISRIVDNSLPEFTPRSNESTFPTLGVIGQSHFHKVAGFNISWNEAASGVAKDYREFRACHYMQNGSNTPEWEAVVRDKRSRNFPLGLFGLPVNFQQVTRGVTETYEVNTWDPDLQQMHRRSSPIWFRFLPTDESYTAFKIITFAFTNRYKDEDHTIRLVQKQNAPVSDSVIESNINVDKSQLPAMFKAWCEWLDVPSNNDPNRPLP